jgi:diguanylate cyclase (GGDEF)-like protein
MESPMGVLFFDDQALMIEANDYMFNLFGMKNGGIEGKKFCDVFLCSKPRGFEECKSCPILKTVREVIRTGNTTMYSEASHEFLKNGRQDTVWFNLKAIPYPLEENQFIIMLLADITKRKYLESNLKNLGITDGETLLYYRKFILEQLEILASDSSLVESPLTIVLIDIDNLDDINHDYSRELGDEIISGLSKIIIKSIRHTDFAGRYSGDKFLLLLPDTNKKGAGILTDRILNLFRSTKFDSLEKPATFSAGILEINHPDININNFLSIVEMLKQQKSEDGKNGWVAASADDYD